MLKLIGPTVAWLRHVGTAAAASVAVVGIIAGLSPDDQTRLLAAVGQFVDGATNLLAALGTIAGIGMAVWARWTAQPAQQVKAVEALPNVAEIVPLNPSKPVTAGAPGATVSSSPLVGLLALILLAGCATAPDGSLDRQKTAANVEASYALVKVTAGFYVALPPCGSDRATAVCSDPAVAAQIAKAMTVADVAVAEATRQILAAGNQGEVTQWVARALSAIAVLTQALATYGVR